MAQRSDTPNAKLTFDKFGGGTLAQETRVLVGSPAAQLIPNNPNRVSLSIISEGNTDVRISQTPNLPGTQGFLLAANGGMIDFSFEEDGESVGYAYYACSSGSSTYVRYREVLRT